LRLTEFEFGSQSSSIALLIVITYYCTIARCSKAGLAPLCNIGSAQSSGEGDVSALLHFNKHLKEVERVDLTKKKLDYFRLAD
jgi:hypothetical protein